MPLQAQRLGVADIVLLPMAGLVQHDLFHLLHQPGAVLAQQQAQMVQRIQRLTVGKGQRRANFQDAEMPTGEGRIDLGMLIIGRMGLKADMRNIRQGL